MSDDVFYAFVCAGSYRRWFHIGEWYSNKEASIEESWVNFISHGKNIDVIKLDNEQYRYLAQRSFKAGWGTHNNVEY